MPIYICYVCGKKHLKINKNVNHPICFTCRQKQKRDYSNKRYKNKI
jgi:hypothetical protein